MRKVALFAVVLALAVTAVAFAQAKPDFSGAWALDATKSDQMGGGGRGPGGPGPMTIKHTATELAITRGENTMTYKLDGTETVIASQRGDSKATAKWEGNALVITTVRPGMDGGAMTTKATYTMEGENLVVTTNMNTPNGEINRKVFYKKGS